MSGHYPLPQLRRHSTRNDPLGLTVRERQAAMSLYAGHSIRETAALLGCKYETVRSLLKAVRRKLRVTSVLGVVAKLREEHMAGLQQPKAVPVEPYEGGEMPDVQTMAVMGWAPKAEQELSEPFAAEPGCAS